MTNLTIWTQSRIKYFEKSSYTESDEQHDISTTMNVYTHARYDSVEKSMGEILNFSIEAKRLKKAE